MDSKAWSSEITVSDKLTVVIPQKTVRILKAIAKKFSNKASPLWGEVAEKDNTTYAIKETIYVTPKANGDGRGVIFKFDNTVSDSSEDIEVLIDDEVKAYVWVTVPNGTRIPVEATLEERKEEIEIPSYLLKYLTSQPKRR